MNRIQKISWLMVICMGSGLVLSAIAITVGYFMAGFPKAWSGMAFMAIGGLGGLGPLIFRKDPGPVQADERDRHINLQAARASFALSYLITGLLNRLKEKAIIGLKSASTSAIIMFLMFGFTLAANALNDFSDNGSVLSRLLWMVLFFGLGYVIDKFRKKKEDMPFDEREMYLLKKAIERSNSTLVIYYSLFILFAFLLLGTNGTLPIWLLFLVLIFGFWLSQLIASLYLLRHTREDDE